MKNNGSNFPNIEEILHIYIEEGTAPKEETLLLKYLTSLPNELSAKIVSEGMMEDLKECIKDFLDRFYTPVERFKIDGKMEPLRVAEYLMKYWNFKTTKDNETIYFYDGGIYNPSGEIVIKEMSQKLLGNDCRNNRVSEIIGHVQRSTYVDRTKDDISLINLKNGLLNVATGEFTKHTPDIFMLNQLPILYNKSVDCPAIKRFIEEVVEKDAIPAIQEYCGYCLFRDYSIAKAFVLVGGGSNGKTTFMRLLEAFLGMENISRIAMQDFDRDPFSMCNLYGKLANVYDDMPSSALISTGKFKQVTGNSPLEARVKFKGDILFTNYAKLIFSCNKIPETYDTTIAFWRRIYKVTFPNVFEGSDADPNLINKLTTSDELSGMLNWALEGLKRLLNQGKFSNEPSIEEIQEIWQRMSSPVAAFVIDKLIINPDVFISKEEMYEVFIKYCKKQGIADISKKSFGSNLPRYAESIRDGWNKNEYNISKRGWYGYEII